MSLFTSNLTVPESIFAATLSLSWILKITEVSGGKSLGGKRGWKSLFHFLGLATVLLKVWHIEQRACSNHNGHHWQQPAVQYSPLLLLFPFLPYFSTPLSSHPTPQYRKSHGWLYTGNSTQKFGPRIYNQPSTLSECKNGPIFLLRAKPLKVRIRVMPQVGENIGREGRAWANLATKEITDFNHTKSVKQEPNPY